MESNFGRPFTGRPFWLPGNNAFWYRKYTSLKEFQIILVSIAERERKVVFDSANEAEALKRIDVGSNTRPLAWLDHSHSGHHVKLWFGDRSWWYNTLKQLQPCDVDTKPPKPQYVASERRTISGCTVTITNETDAALSLTWIDWDGEYKFYTTIDSGSSHRQRTYDTHVWQVAESESGLIKSLFQASAEPEQHVIIRKSRSDSLMRVHELEARPSSEATDGTVFVDEGALWYREPPNGGSRQIAKPKDNRSYDKSHIYPSPDARYVAAWQRTPGGDGNLTLVESSPANQLYPKVHQRPYWRPGDKVIVHRPRLFDLQSNCEVPTTDDLFSNPSEVTNIGWSDDGREYRFLYVERGTKIARVIGVDVKGIVQVHIEEQRATFVDPQKLDWRILEHSDEMLWCSERSDYNHLYLFSFQDGSMSQLTHGTWNVKSIEHFDEADRRVWFSCCGIHKSQDPYFTHLASVQCDDSSITILTDGNGTHSWTWSPDKTYFTDTWSRVDASPTSVVRDSKSGQSLMEVEKGGGANVWCPERFAAAGRDGETLIYGVIVRPKDFDGTKRYPILDDIYAGPQDFFTPKSFTSYGTLQRWADEGFVVIRADGMGTNWRGKKFHDMCYKNLRDAGLPDHIEWLKAAAATRPWMDLSRVGIIGTSAGGQSAVAALINHGDFFEVAAADSGCHDNRLDKWWWNERYMGYPVDESYSESSNIENADKINCPVLLVVGELDDNVDPACTLRLVHALQRASKEHELVFVPGGKHGCGSEGFARRRQVAFLQSHLGVAE